MGKRINIVRMKVEFTPTLEWSNEMIKTHGMTVTKIGRVSIQADVEFTGGDVEDFNRAHLAAANFMADIEAAAETLHESSIDVTSCAGPLPAFGVGDTEASD